MLYRQACVQPRPLAVNTALPRLLLSAVLRPRATSSRLLATGLCQGCSSAAAEGRTDARQLHRPCSAYYVGSVNKGRQSNLVGWLE